MPALKNTEQTAWKAATVRINMTLKAWDKESYFLPDDQHNFQERGGRRIHSQALL